MVATSNQPAATSHDLPFHPAHWILVFGPDSVGIDVKDNGKGFDPDTPHEASMQGGFGLTGMEQRAESLGGNLAVRSEKGKGTLVEVRIPK